jgi:hypothetical protein
VTSSRADPAAALSALAANREPFLIGVRHHSPAVAAALPALLDGFAPELLLLELPVQFQPWLEWLSHPETIAPVALAGSSEPLSFYPFADFSPELVAVRWARRHGVEVVAFDLPVGDPGWNTDREPGAASAFTDALRESASGRRGDDVWDRVVEAPAPGSTAEQVRRAALAYGWATRADEGPDVSPVDLRREAYMRSVLADHAGRRCAAVVGAFHAPALLSGEATGADRVDDVVTSLVAYADPLLDSRSGYPAGIRDPRWQAIVVDSRGDPAVIAAATVGLVVEICGEIRAGGHPAGPGEAREVVRVAHDLARLRGLPAPARGELVEALTTVLTQAEPLGRGRVVAKAMERVLVGDRRGRLAPGTPRSGLAPAVEQLLRELRLPHPEDSARRDLRLDPLRSPLDGRRELALQRLRVCGISYAEPTDVQGVGSTDSLTTRWTAEWTPTTAALIEVAGLRGVTLEQASEGILRQVRALEHGEGGSTARQILDGSPPPPGAGSTSWFRSDWPTWQRRCRRPATLAELLGGLDLLARLGAGTLPGPTAPLEVGVLIQELHEAAIRQVNGLAGSTEVADARSLLAPGRPARGPRGLAPPGRRLETPCPAGKPADAGGRRGDPERPRSRRRAGARPPGRGLARPR